MKPTRILSAAAVIALAALTARGEKAAPLGDLAEMPVKEITIFKDGHAFVLHEGQMPTDAAGHVVLDYLPTPVLGTFWPYSADKAAKLSGVVAGRRKVRLERTALELRELLEANVGASVLITEKPQGERAAPAAYAATILALPRRSGEELEAIAPPNSGEMLPQSGNLILLKTAEGTKAVEIARIQDVTFKDELKPKLAQEEFRNLLTLRLSWPGGKAGKQAEVGIFYLGKGLRWIPEYKVVLDGAGNAHLTLQGTLINELTDLNDVTAHLVVGVPSFAFQELVDPISLQQAFAQLSQSFRRDSRSAFALSNTIMSQVAMPERGAPQPAGGGVDLGPDVAEGGKSEDLFVFSLEHVTLRKGQRMVLPVAEFDLKYRDVYTLDIPFSPPPEIRRNFDRQQLTELARLLQAPKVQHSIRLSNTSKVPLTTAPALLLRGQQVLAQGMMKYTAVGGQTDLEVTTAVDVNVRKTDQETNRIPNAVRWNKDDYGRIDLQGKIVLLNHRTDAIDLEITRHVLGNVDKADHDGKIEMVNAFEDVSFGPGTDWPAWWWWYGWPYWWHHFNGIGRINWTLTLQPGKSVELNYAWHYFWR